MTEEQKQACWAHTSRTCDSCKECMEAKEMRISFSREWNQSTIRNIVNNNCYLRFGDHEDLKALCVCPFAEDETFYEPDYQELTFVVPKEWLMETAKEMFEVEGLDDWLQNEYTTDESELIFERALNERQVVMVDFM